MAQISVKYKCGDDVSCYGVNGKVTAIFVRGRGRTYEFSYLNNGSPACVNAQDYELEAVEPTVLGFKKEKK